VAAGGTDALRRIDALIQVGLRLARSASSRRLLLARVAVAIDSVWLPCPWGDELEAARISASERCIRRRSGGRWGRLEHTPHETSSTISILIRWRWMRARS
jgi:hypothetical protein